MKRSEAMKESNEKILKAVAQINIASDHIGSCSAESMTDGMVRECIRMMRKLNDIAMEVSRIAECLDWDLDDEAKTVQTHKNEGEAAS